jgi:hypothetical protein
MVNNLRVFQYQGLRKQQMAHLKTDRLSRVKGRFNNRSRTNRNLLKTGLLKTGLLKLRDRTTGVYRRQQKMYNK